MKGGDETFKEEMRGREEGRVAAGQTVKPQPVSDGIEDENDRAGARHKLKFEGYQRSI